MRHGMRASPLSGLLVINLVQPLVADVQAQLKVPEAILIGGTIAQSGKMSADVGTFKKMMDVWPDVRNERGASRQHLSPKSAGRYAVEDGLARA